MDWKEQIARFSKAGDTYLFNIGDTPITLGTVLIVALICLLTVIGSRALQGALRRGLSARKVNEGTVGLVASMANYVFLAIGFGIALETAGIGVSNLFAAGALFAVAIGFAMQSIMQNFVSGMILLSEHSIRPGDVLEVEGLVVRVIRIGIRATVVRTRDGENIIVPNSTIVQSSVKNFTLDDQLIRARVSVGVTYGSDMALVRKVLQETLDNIEWRCPEPPPAVLMVGFGDNSVNFEAAVWVDDPWSLRVRNSDLHEAIWNALKAHGIVIAFPQVDIHLDPLVEEQLVRLASGTAPPRT